MRNMGIERTCALALLIGLCFQGAASGILTEYEFVVGHSTLIQTGGIGGWLWRHDVRGEFSILVDCVRWTASIRDVNATYADGRDLGALFDMTHLQCVDMNDTGIVFELPATSEGVVIPRSAIRLAVVYKGETIRLSGGFYEDVCDGFQYRLEAVAQAPSRTIYVGPDGDDGNDGLTPQTALKHIQTGIGCTPIGWTVVVLPGIYTEDVNFRGKNLTVVGEDLNGFESARNTIIDGSVVFRGTEGPDCVLAGFTIKGVVSGFDANLDPLGAYHAKGTISHCLIQNIATGCGRLIAGFDGLVENCVVADSAYMCARPSPVWTIEDCSAEFRNCALWNLADGLGVGAGYSVWMENCIANCGIGVAAGGTLEVRYCDIIGGRSAVTGDGEITWGPGNIDADPCFATDGQWSTVGDYHLKSQAGRYDPANERWVKDGVTSPCIDAGNPDWDWSAEPWPHGQRINMGAYGGTSEASKSLSTAGCFPLDHPDHGEWVKVGMPECWCFPRQCRGDADGRWEGTLKCGQIYYVRFYDLNVLMSTWNIAEPPHGPGVGSAGICADFDHAAEGSSKTGYYRVHFNDLNILMAHWYINAPPFGPGIPADCGGTLEP